MSLLERFLQYSLRHQRPIRVMVTQQEVVKNLTLTVQAVGEDGILYLSARNKTQPKKLFYEQILGASYARGDDGDTLRKREQP